MLHVSPDRPIEPSALGVLTTVQRVAEALALDWLVIGAMARDIMLKGVFDLDAGRATRDVDLAVVVSGWNQFEDLKSALLGTALFREARGIAHRLYYATGGGSEGYPLDVIPFGGTEQPEHVIAWPPDRQVMNVAGYGEALAAALEVEVAPGLVIRVASLPGLAILKLFAWRARRNLDARDAADLAILFRRYADAGNLDRLYGDEMSALETVDFRVELAGPRLLGRDVRRIIAAPTADRIGEILDREADRLVTDLAKNLRSEDPVAEAEALLEQFRTGIDEEEIARS